MSDTRVMSKEIVREQESGRKQTRCTKARRMMMERKLSGDQEQEEKLERDSMGRRGGWCGER